MFSSCEHFATRAHLLPSVLSHFHISISSVSSRSDSHAHCSHARLRSRSVSCRATSSCLRHLWRWRHSSYASTPIGRRYSMPAGRVNTSDAVVLGRPHAHLYAWTHTASSRSSSFSVHGTNAAEYCLTYLLLVFPIPPGICTPSRVPRRSPLAPCTPMFHPSGTGSFLSAQRPSHMFFSY